MKLSALTAAGRSPSLPLTIVLPEGEVQLLSWARVLPGQRYVAEAQWQGKHVLAKLMVGAKAERSFKREREGVGLLHDQQVSSPALLADGFEQGEGGWLLFDFIEQAQSVEQQWRAVSMQPLLSDGQVEVLGRALSTLAGLHSRGLWHDDLHLDNLLGQGDTLYVIDGGGVQAERAGTPLSRDRALDNLGVFFAQLPPTLDAFLEELLVHYLLVNSEHALPLEALLKRVSHTREWRLQDYLKKAGRECSLFSVDQGVDHFRVIRRSWLDKLSPVFDDVDGCLEGGVRYKGGGSATVARIEVRGEPLLLKRYNIKGVSHWLRRFWRPSRAWHSWIEGLRLEFLGIATARPLGMLELRWMGLRRRAYLVTEHLDGEDIIARFAPYVDSTPPEEELLALDSLFAALRLNRISHGDLKGHNIFWHEGRWTLIDLDAVQQHRTDERFAFAYARDRARLLRNWPAESPLHALLDARLPKS
jgi:tRNA A-37 threonylcarbamoyl transferase component Bud32